MLALFNVQRFSAMIDFLCKCLFSVLGLQIFLLVFFQLAQFQKCDYFEVSRQCESQITSVLSLSTDSLLRSAQRFRNTHTGNKRGDSLYYSVKDCVVFVHKQSTPRMSEVESDSCIQRLENINMEQGVAKSSSYINWRWSIPPILQPNIELLKLLVKYQAALNTRENRWVKFPGTSHTDHEIFATNYLPYHSLQWLQCFLFFQVDTLGQMQKCHQPSPNE